MDILVWIVIFTCYIVVKAAKVKTSSRGSAMSKPNVPRKNTPVNSTYKRVAQPERSFAAMPKQKSAKPNAERNCAADDKHYYENNISGHGEERASAIPNTPSANMHIQPKMSGNRKVAKQRYMGDAVERGMRVIVCSYCAAENMVPYNARNEYKCYFCHYDI